MKKCFILFVLLFVCVLAVAAAEGAAPGDILAYGRYEQDNDPGNGPEPIEWLVLDVREGKALLLSKYDLDCRLYHSDCVDVTWETCDLRAWLNGDFLSAAFTPEEQAQILLTEVDNSDAQKYADDRTTGGNNTEDRVFVLSYAEAYRYFQIEKDDSENVASRTSPTAYAQANDAFANTRYQTAEGNNAGWWWLRSPDYFQYSVSIVDPTGGKYGFNVNVSRGCVRPALWIDLSAAQF